MSESPPSVDGWPLIGNTVQFARDAFGFVETRREYGDVVRTDVAGRETYTLTHPDLDLVASLTTRPADRVDLRVRRR
jgi:hypothetical protein